MRAFPENKGAKIKSPAHAHVFAAYVCVCVHHSSASVCVVDLERKIHHVTREK